jgi:peptidoglycan-associated lipoprotein
MGRRLLPLVAVGLLLAFFGTGCSAKKKGAGEAGGVPGLEDQSLSGDSLARAQAGLSPGDGSGPLKDVHFAFDSFELDESARQTLQQSSEWLKEHPKAKVEIEGHTDERGTVEYNLALGAKRARAAKDYLVTLGASADRLSTISYGEELPLCREHDDSCWGRNRRAHFVVLGAD